MILCEFEVTVDQSSASNEIGLVTNLKKPMLLRERPSVMDCAGMFFPGLKCCESLFTHQGNHRDFALSVGLSNFGIDGGIIKADLGGIFGKITEIHFLDSCPVDRAQTHRIRLTRGIEIAAS